MLLKIETSHATALYLKRNYLNENIEAAILNSKKKQADFDSYGLINHGAQPYKIWTTARPPKLADYQYLDDSCSSARKIIFGPEFMEDKRKNVNDWLRKKLSVEFFNEGQIDDLIKSV